MSVITFRSGLRSNGSLEQFTPSGVAVRRQDELDGQRKERREPRAVVGARLFFGKPVVGYRTAGQRVAEHEGAPCSASHRTRSSGLRRAVRPQRPRDLELGGTPGVPRTRERSRSSRPETSAAGGDIGSIRTRVPSRSAAYERTSGWSCHSGCGAVQVQSPGRSLLHGRLSHRADPARRRCVLYRRLTRRISDQDRPSSRSSRARRAATLSSR